MASFGSSTAPSFAGWIQHSVVGYQFASKYTSPAFDILITELHAYMDASISAAHGNCVMWLDGGSFPIAISGDIGSMAIGGNSAGSQAWHVLTLGSPYLLPASTVVWLGGYSKGGIVFSTYDTNPGAWLGVSANGSSGPGPFSGMSFSNQGPCGAYAVYSQVKSSSVFDMGGSGALVIGNQTLIKQGSANLGTASPGGGLDILGTAFASQRFLGDNGGGIAPVVTNVKHSLVAIWRPA